MLHNISYKGDDTVLILRSTEDEIKDALRVLVENDFVECSHEFTHKKPVDDTRYFGMDGELHEKSNPDALVCDICGKVWNPSEREWE